MPFKGQRYTRGDGSRVGDIADGSYESRINDLQEYVEALTARLDALPDGSINLAPANGKTVKSVGLPGVWRTEWFGAKWDGATDDTAAWVATIAAAIAGGGGEIECPIGTSLIAGQLAIPFATVTGNYPRNASLKIRGKGADTQQASSGGNGPLSGTILNLTYNSGTGNQCKIDARGRGNLEICSLSLMDNSAAAATIGTPFLHTTFTVCWLHHLAVYGSPSLAGASCIQDAFIMGGTSVTTDIGFNAPYQGYGSVVESCWFDHIRRAVLGQSYCNGLRVERNTVWQNCGSNLAGGAAIEIAGDPTGTGNSIGCTIMSNYLETPGYAYPIKLSYANNNFIAANDMEDHNARTLSFVRFDVQGSYNVLIGTYGNTVTPLASEDATVVGTNWWLDPRQNQVSQFAGQVAHLTRLTSKNNPASPTGVYLQDTAGDVVFPQFFPGANPTLQWQYVPNGAGGLWSVAVRWVGTTGANLEFQASATGEIKFGGTGLSKISATAATGMLGLGVAAPATTATGGFVGIPVMAGAPTGTPSASAGYAPMVADSTNNKLWVYINGAWKGVVVA